MNFTLSTTQVHEDFFFRKNFEIYDKIENDLIQAYIRVILLNKST